MSECVCGFNPPNDCNPDCERCGLVAAVDRLEAKNERLREALRRIEPCENCPDHEAADLCRLAGKIAREALRQEGGADDEKL